MLNNRTTMWIAGGTADIRVKKYAYADNDAGVIRNERQMIFSFASDLTTQTGVYTRDDFKPLNPADPADILNVSEGKKGWYFELEKETQKDFRENVSTKPVLINGVLYIATFTQKDKIATGNSATCAPERTLTGDSRLYAVDLMSGKPVTWTGKDGKTPSKYITFENVKIVSLTDLDSGGKGKLLMRFDMLGAHNLEKLFAEQPKLASVYSADSGGKNLDMATIEEEAPKGVSNLPPGKAVINYWLVR
jgi:hypothetical protein